MLECSLRVGWRLQRTHSDTPAVGVGFATTELREQTLLELAKRDATDLEATYKAVTEAASVLVGVARASIWRFATDTLVCDDLFLRDEARHTSGQTLSLSSSPSYFSALSKTLALVARDAPADPRTHELEASYLGPLGIGAMLDTPIWQAGGSWGVLCCEHIGGARRWTAREERDAGRLADLVARSIEASARRATEERSKIILDAIPQFVLVVDEVGTVVEASAIAMRALKEDGGSSFSGRFEDLELRDLAGELLPVAQWPAERARRGDTVHAEIVEISSRITGQKRWMRATSAPVMIGGRGRAWRGRHLRGGARRRSASNV